MTCDSDETIDRRHIPMAKVMPGYPKLITCMAPTKTFNLAMPRSSIETGLARMVKAVREAV